MGSRGEHTKPVSACPLCGEKYNPAESRIIAEKEAAYLLHTYCKKCGSSVVSTLIASSIGISSVGLVTDFSYEDAVKFKDAKGIKENDVLDVYNFLTEFKGNLRDSIK